MLKWTETEHELPANGEPVLVVCGSTVQNITYTLEAAGDDHDSKRLWFQPYHFEVDLDELMIDYKGVSKWCYLSDIQIDTTGE